MGFLMIDIRELALFRGFQPGQLDLLESMFMTDHAQAGTVLFKQGDPAHYLYVLLEGEVHLYYKPEDESEITLAKIKPEGIVGWSAALGNPEYTSSAVCMMDCQMLRIHGQDLRRLCELYPKTGSVVLDRLAAMVADRWHGKHPNVMALLEHGIHTHPGS